MPDKRDSGVPALGEESHSARRVVLTGGTGFIGRRICRALEAEGLALSLLRRKREGLGDNGLYYDLDASIPQPEWFDNALCLIHCAARVHVTDRRDANDMDAFRRNNVDATVSLVEQAVACGVPHVVFLSTAAVYGVDSSETPIGESQALAPRTPYGISKLEAEEEIRRLCEGTDTRFTIVRVPLVYGPRAPGNFGALEKLARSNLPLPFKGAGNRRSMVHVNNLAAFIAHLVVHPPQASSTLLFTDGHVFGTDELLAQMRYAHGRSAQLFYVPRPLIKTGLALLGRSKMYRQLFGDLEFVPSPEIAQLGWRAPVSTDDAFAAMGRDP